MKINLEQFKQDIRSGVISCDKEELKAICYEFFRYTVHVWEEHKEEVQYILQQLLEKNIPYQDSNSLKIAAEKFGADLGDFKTMACNMMNSFCIESLICILCYPYITGRSEKEKKDIDELKEIFEMEVLQWIFSIY